MTVSQSICLWSPRIFLQLRKRLISTSNPTRRRRRQWRWRQRFTVSQRLHPSGCDCFCFRVSSYLSLPTFSNLSGLVIWRQRGTRSDAGADAERRLHTNVQEAKRNKKQLNRKESHRFVAFFFTAARAIGIICPCKRDLFLLEQVHQKNNEINVALH